MNSKWQPLELCCGIATGLVALINPATLFEVELFKLSHGGDAFISLVNLIVLFLGPGLLVAVGSYIHTTQEKTIGFVFTIVGGSILVPEFPLLFFGAFGYGGIVYSQGLAAALYMLLLSPLAGLTMIGALLVRRSLRQDRPPRH